MIWIHQLKLPVSHTEEELAHKIQKTLHIKERELLSYTIQKKSLDARKKPELFYVYSVRADVANEPALKKRIRSRDVVFGEKSPSYECHASGNAQLRERPVIIGTGPAGLFCGLELARLGYRPILLERGGTVNERIKDVETFWAGGTLNPESNVQFGEGGAGTFSDGKLNTLVKDPKGRNHKVLGTFVDCGAPVEILYENKPHLGTDLLTGIVTRMRAQIESFGGQVRFHEKVIDFLSEETKEGRKLSALLVENTLTKETYTLQTEAAVLAIGHSARDTFAALAEKEIPMEAKSFAVGVRIEHPQKMIDFSQYGRERGTLLPAAAYKMTATLPSGRGFYTFCMCPGGYVVNASSEEGGLCVNGMSYHDRGGANANSAVIVTVSPEDYGDGKPLSGVAFQRQLEAAAYREGKGSVPVQRFEDFCCNCPSDGSGEILPQIKGAFRWSNVRTIFPDFLAQSIEEGILSFDKKIKGYAAGDAILSGVESRTSSPVRIVRDAHLQSSLLGLYPCGEGAGYAGGITSAAMDGLKVAEAIAKIYRPFDNRAIL